MPKFKFKLDALKRYREHRVLVAKRDLMEVEGRRQGTVEKIRHCESELLSVLGPLYTDVRMLPLLGDLARGQNQKIDRLRLEMAEIEKELERHRAWVAHLSKELKAVERLEEKKRQIFDENVKKADRRIQDAWVVERWSTTRDPGSEEGAAS